ncbi:hypothetical protein [Bradyrhizobium sp. OAE829]|uniref:hypothetical protein n=1 Tax=Bradyrhizobium sp. OAE829 TaxID=2663807 RepID=UPI001789089F
MEHAQAFEPIQDNLYIEKINGSFLFGDKATPAQYSAGGCSCELRDAHLRPANAR